KLVGSSPTLSMDPTALVGLAVSSYSSNSLSTATFSNISVQTGTTSLVLAIDAGGAAIGSFVADTNFSGNSSVGGAVSHTIHPAAATGLRSLPLRQLRCPGRQLQLSHPESDARWFLHGPP